jgi:hypothetical protein
MPRRRRTLPPPPAPASHPCVWGGSPTVGWRWYPSTGWERVCERHIGRDFVPDTAKTERQAP